MPKHKLGQASFIAKNSTGAILERSLQSFGFTLRIFSSLTDYVPPDATKEQAVFVELDIKAFQEKRTKQEFDFLRTCEFSADLLFFYCPVNSLRPEHLSSPLRSLSMPVCYLAAPVDPSLVKRILQGNDNGFIKRHDLRNGAILMEIYNHLTTLRHDLWNCMSGTNDLLRRLIRSPSEISDLMGIIPREADGQLRAEALSAEYRRGVDSLIDILPDKWADLVMKRYKKGLSFTNNLNTLLSHLIARQGDVASLSVRILKTEDSFEKYSKSFKDYLYQAAKGVIRSNE